MTFDPRVLELAEAQGYDTSVAIACLYQLQKRGAPTDNLDLLIQEINKQSHHHQRECSICLCKEIDSLLLPCRYVPLPVCARAYAPDALANRLANARKSTGTRQRVSTAASE